MTKQRPSRQESSDLISPRYLHSAVNGEYRQPRLPRINLNTLERLSDTGGGFFMSSTLSSLDSKHGNDNKTTRDMGDMNFSDISTSKLGSYQANAANRGTHPFKTVSRYLFYDFT